MVRTGYAVDRQTDRETDVAHLAETMELNETQWSVISSGSESVTSVHWVASRLPTQRTLSAVVSEYTNSLQGLLRSMDYDSSHSHNTL